ncbi:hypothetical protein BJV74DRAFT_984234 [Russula compacta]|nr:hypothetical protein BJV74DRAFT_984234 [Russula compacta]
MQSSKATAKLPIPVQIKRELSVPSSQPSDDEITITTAPNDGLPTFARARWATRFLPTLSDRLASASDSWDIGNGANIIVIIQGVLDKVYPGSGYMVKFGDKIYSMDCLNDRRTLIGSHAIKIVDDHFAQAQYVNKLKAITKYAKWAIRQDGPMVWQTPTPEHCTVEITSPDYIKPVNIFESTFMIVLLAPFLKSCQGSCHNHGDLKGAVALGAAALRCAFSMYTTGVRVKAHQFSRENSAETVALFATNTGRLSERRWAQLKVSYGVDSTGKGKQKALAVDLLDAQQFRELYIPSSP